LWERTLWKSGSIRYGKADSDAEISAQYGRLTYIADTLLHGSFLACGPPSRLMKVHLIITLKT
jgi:hypothetical protein